MEEYAEPPTACQCTGVRYCLLCVNSDRVKRIREDAEKNGADLARAVFEKNKQHLPQSSCSFSALPIDSPLMLCVTCGKIFVKPSPDATLDSILGCSAHEDPDWSRCLDDVQLRGLFTFRDMISDDYETLLCNFLDGKPRLENPDQPSPFPGWKDSQSGRRKQDFGPAPNFKKRKVKSSELPGMPIELQRLLESMMHDVDVVTVNAETELPPFVIAQASCLDYDAAALANLDPHIDDVWLWGPRVAGISLLAGCIMTFVHEDGHIVDVHLPRRWGFVMSGESRYKWLHGIRHTGIKGRRYSITMRELEPSAGLDEELQAKILSFAQAYV